MGRLGMQGLFQDVARAAGASTAAGAYAELLAQFAEGATPVGDGAADVAFGYGVADADIHGGSGLLGKNELVLAGTAQAVNVAAMRDVNFVLRAQQHPAVERRRDRRRRWCGYRGLSDGCGGRLHGRGGSNL